MGQELPEEIVARFRRGALERLSAIENAWGQLTRGAYSAELERELHRQVHTLKGDARIVGFSDVNHLCQKLEDLLFFASQRRFRVPDDIDCLVTMALQFIGMLVRKKMGASLGGIDLAGFTRQIEGALRDAGTSMTEVVESPSGEAEASAGQEIERLSASTRRRLSLAATAVFVESLSASPACAERLRRSWRVLAGSLRNVDGVPLEPVLTRHKVATADLAGQLGKLTELDVQAPALQVSAQLVEALDVALLHAISNAVDHGIEPPEARLGAGKNAIARIEVRLRELPHSLELTIQDDGAGIDLDRIRQRAVAMNLLSPAQAERAASAALLELVFHPGFSTREQVSAVSGRGIGLNAVRAAVTRVGGTVTLHSEPGRGTKLLLRLPRVAGQLTVQRLSLARTRIPIALPATCRIASAGGPGSEDLPDLGALLGLCGKGMTADEEARTLYAGSGEHRLRIEAASPPVMGTAVRLCPTAESDPYEVVSVAGVETLLVRPEAVHAQVADDLLLLPRVGAPMEAMVGTEA